MPPHLVLFSFLIFAAWLIKRDIALRPGLSPAIWIPTLWVGILASKPVSTWLGTGGGLDSLDGSPIDRLFFLTMILAACFTLSRRDLDWRWLIARNWPIFLFYGFLFISISWSNFPFVSFKRWFKETGNILVALVILTEANPLQAFKAVFVRCGYLLIPLSIIFIRYFPDLGRRYSRSGNLEVIGVTTQKNSLGTMVLVCGIVLIWDLVERTRSQEVVISRVDRNLPLGLGVIAAWLLYLSDSKTSMLALITAGVIICSVRLPVLRDRINRFGFYFLLGAIGFFAIDRTIGLTEAIVTSLGRDMTFTGRANIWRELLNVGTDPLLGTGFMSFWDDAYFRSILPYWVSKTAHNSFLEVYLTGGWVGVTVLALMLFAIGVRLNRGLVNGDNYAVVRFAIFVAMVIASFAESNFACMSPLGFLFLLAAIGHARPAPTQDTSFLSRFETGTEARRGVSDSSDLGISPTHSHQQ